MSIEAMKLALDFISRLKFADAEPEPEKVMQVLEQAIEQAQKQDQTSCYCPNCEALSKQLEQVQKQQEPVAWMKEGWGPDCGPYIEFYRDDEMGWRDRKEWIPLYTSPPQRQPLTDDAVWKIVEGTSVGFSEIRAIEAAIEAAHQIGVEK